MNIYVFSSINRTNIWAGISARKWAVSKSQSDNPSTRTKSQKLPIGSLGIFYCVETKSLTTPFMIRSKPLIDDVIKNIWDEIWSLPFGIIPLGSPDKEIHKDELKIILPSLKNNEKKWNQLFLFAPFTVFQSSKLLEEDWSILINLLV